MTAIQTTKGILDTGDLKVKDFVTYEDNARVIATEWYDGKERVRRDVTVSMLTGIDAEVEQQGIG